MLSRSLDARFFALDAADKILKFYKEMFNDDLFTLMSYSCVENKGRVNV